MTRKKVYLIIQTILCILLVAVLSCTVVDMYHDGAVRAGTDVLAWFFSRELVAERFAPIAPLFFLAIGFGIAGLVLGIRDEKQDEPVQDAELKRDLLAARVAEPSDAMKAEQVRQKRLQTAGWIGFAICMIPILVYVTNGEHFPQGDVQLEQMIRSLAAAVLPFAILGIACLAVTSVLQEKSILREISAAQERIKEEKAAGIKKEEKAAGIKAEEKPTAGSKPAAEPEPAAGPKPAAQGRVRLVLLILAAVFIVAGVLNGSAGDVLMKAIKICTECIGLG